MAEKKAPRVRKMETVRDRNQKAVERATAKATKVRKKPVKAVANKLASPLKKPVRVASKPFKTKPVKFIGKWLGRILLPKYFRNSYKELRQVTWPSRRETWKLTFAVLVFTTVFGLLIIVTDYGLDKIIRRIVLR